MTAISNNSIQRAAMAKPTATAGRVAADAKPEAELDPKKLWKPAAEWAGRLILPNESERRDGGVYFEVRQAPRQFPQLQGKRVWLEFEKSDWVERVTTDVEFSKRTEASEGNGNVHPERLDGWKNVSPMESLASARAKDDMLVQLKQPKLVNGKLVVEREPVQVSGTQKALVTFEKKIDAHTWQVRHYNPESKAFDGPSETISTSGRSDLAPMKDRRLNAKGWYVYGDSDSKGKMTVAALEPRELLQVKSDQLIRGQDQSVEKRTVNVHEAKTHLSSLLEEVRGGCEIIIAKAGKPYARLLPLETPETVPLGFLQGHVPDSFFDELPEDELRAWEL